MSTEPSRDVSLVCSMCFVSPFYWRGFGLPRSERQGQRRHHLLFLGRLVSSSLYHGLTRTGDIGTRNGRLVCFPSKPRSMFGDRTNFGFPGPNASRNRGTPFSNLGIPIRHTPADVNLSPAPLVVIMVDFPYVYVPGFYMLLRYILKTYTRVREIRQKPL